MRKIIELNYGTNCVKSNMIWQRPRMRHVLPQGTATMFLAYVPVDNKYYRGITNGFCRVCGNLMIIPGAEWHVSEDGYIECPCCGAHHKSENVIYAYDCTMEMPLKIDVKLMEYKERIELTAIYPAVILGKNIYEDFKQNITVKEKYIFNTSCHDVKWEKVVKWIEGNEEQSKFESMEIGYLSDLGKCSRSVFKFVPWNITDKNGLKISDLLRELRNVINARMKKAGYSNKSLFVNCSHIDIVPKNLLLIAHRTRFWDAEINDYYGNLFYKNIDDEKVRNYFKEHIPDIEEAEKAIYKMMTTNGMSYQKAFIKQYGLPNHKVVRKNLSFHNVKTMKRVYAIKDVALGDCLLPLILPNKDCLEWVEYYYKNFGELYKKTPVEVVAFCDSFYGKDTLRSFKELDKESKAVFFLDVPKFKELHDRLSYLLAKQDDREVEYDIPADVIRRFDIEVENSRCETLRKYSQLKKVGMDLKNCATSYRRRVNEDLQLVVMTDDRGKAIVLIEIEKGAIVQAKLFANKKVKDNIEYNKKIVEFAEKSGLAIRTDDVNLKAPETTKILKIV